MNMPLPHSCFSPAISLLFGDKSSFEPGDISGAPKSATFDPESIALLRRLENVKKPPLMAHTHTHRCRCSRHLFLERWNYGFGICRREPHTSNYWFHSFWCFSMFFYLYLGLLIFFKILNFLKFGLPKEWCMLCWELQIG